MRPRFFTSLRMTTRVCWPFLVNGKAMRIFPHPPAREDVVRRRCPLGTAGEPEGLGPLEPFQGLAVGCIKTHATKH